MNRSAENLNAADAISERWTACPVEAALPVTLSHVHELNNSAACWRMNESLIADVDADVRKRPAQGVKKNEVARLQLVCCYRNTQRTQCLSGAREQDASATVDILNESAAIEAVFRGAAAVAVSNTDLTQRMERKLTRAGGKITIGSLGEYNRPPFARISIGRRSTAGQKHHPHGDDDYFHRAGL